jgi:multiple sugar transport system substrate-binding protein
MVTLPKYMNWRIRLTAVLLTAVILLIGCHDKEKTPTVQFLVWGDPLEQATFRAIVDRFELLNPDVQVEMNGLPGKTDFSAQLAMDFAAGSPPDIFVLDYRRLAQFNNMDSLQPLDALLAHSDVIAEADFYAVALDAFRDSQGTLVCIPQNISSQVVYYNRDLFDQAGLPYPDPNWDWESFRQTARALTLPDSNGDGEADQFGLGMEPTILRMAPFIWQNGGELVDNWANPTTLTIDSAESQQALEFVIALSVRDGVLPSATQEAVQSHGNRFLNGNIAMYVNSRRITPTLRESADFKWDVAPLPHGKQAATVLHSDGYCMARNSTDNMAAWRFIEFAASEEGQQIASQLGRAVPSMKSVANSPYFLDSTQPPAHAQVWLDVIPDLRLLPRLENWSQIERTSAIVFELAYLGRQPLVISISEIQQISTERFAPLR